MAIGTISYLPRSRALITDSAERSETSCSPERPPKITPTLSFFDKDCSLNRPYRAYRAYFLLHNFFSKRRHDQLHAQLGGLVRDVQDRVDLGQLEGKHLARIGDLLHRQMALTIGRPAGNRSSHA